MSKTCEPRHVPHVTVLGGGVAGLSIGHYARRRGLPFTILEAADDVGGLCRTGRRGAFGFDLGAHRFHDKDSQVTRIPVPVVRQTAPCPSL